MIIYSCTMLPKSSEMKWSNCEVKDDDFNEMNIHNEFEEEYQYNMKFGDGSTIQTISMVKGKEKAQLKKSC